MMKKISFNYTVAICAIAKSEDDYLKEWIEYHIRIGFEHIYLIDNNESDTLAQLLKEFTETGYLTIIPFLGIPHVQAQAYEYVTQFYGDNTEWMAYIDIDEFIVLRKDAKISDFLKRYANLPAIGANWICYGANGQIYKLPGNVMDRFPRSSELEKSKQANYAIKSISKPYVFNRIYDASFRHVHRWSLPIFNEKREIIKGNTHLPSHELIAINHYCTKSYEEFRNKKKRGSAMFAGEGNYAYDTFFSVVNEDDMREDVEKFEKNMNTYPSPAEEMK